ncbi:ATP-dependent DNA helicase Q4 [Acipenser ruthenus]|uniref:ATP-dependent DNA helicase Q4 n=1 Tax=Acipenser ruthenus TaxID=7906 RepID=A0A444TWU4_ACIRT|nr:ATP-dependent DNA helicase Q4 [Acipenser ruthenus]
MDRYNNLKVLLKSWESSFIQEHKRKPNKDDVDNAPEEMRELYKEYRAMKRARESENAESRDHENSEPVGRAQRPEPHATEKVPEADCWGSHLNRANAATTPKLTPKEKESLKTSAQYFGMKLKSNLGAYSKDRPTSLRKSFTPKRTPLKSCKENPDPMDKTDLVPPMPKPANTTPNPTPVPTLDLEEKEEPFPTIKGFTPSRITPSPASAPKGLRSRVQCLQQSMTKRLLSVDPGWLERCQVFGDMEDQEKPVVGNLATPAPPPKESDWDFEDDESEYLPVSVTKKKQEPQKPLKCEKPLKLQETGESEDDAPFVTKVVPEKKEVKKASRKRRRVADSEGEECLETPEKGAAKKKRRTKKESRSTARKISESDESDKEEGARVGPEKAKAKVPAENLLGEIEYEEVRVSRAEVRNSAVSRTAPKSDGNFVKINLKRKSHVKGYALKGAALRKQMYVQKFQLKGERFGGGGGGGRGGRRGGFNRSGDSCFKCGGTGHWARDCKGTALAPAPEKVLDEEEAAEEQFELPTLEEVARSTSTLRSDPIVPSSFSQEDKSQMKEEDHVFMNVIRPDYEKPTPPPAMEPLYSLGEDGKVIDTPAEVYEALAEFGYKSFRPGQEVALMRILSGLSTLVVLSTGMGKSLCYQLPAYLYAKRSKSIALVVSPLVSLMDDQVSGLPPKVKAVCIHSNMSKNQREAAIEKVKEGNVHVLLLSPEALVGGGHAGPGCLPPADQLPPVAFACIDEAHCVSEWSHNFRPCYLRLCKVLRNRLGVRCLLGLTATATLATARDIAHHLEIRDEDGIAVRSAAIPPNLQLSVSMDRDRDQALVCLLKGDRFGSLDSVIVYCTRREETSRIAALLRTCMQGVLLKESSEPLGEGEGEAEDTHGKRKKALAKRKIRKPLKWMAESYHAGMTGAQRRRVQNNFMCGELRIVVATVAFGMGLDKSDVRGIIHYNMPKSFESYVQEIGRAGRDGKPAHCHLFLDPDGGDLSELRRHIYVDTVDFYTVKKLVQKAFPPCMCLQIHQKQQDLMRAVEVGDAEMFDLLDPSNEPSADQQEPKQGAEQGPEQEQGAEQGPEQEQGAEQGPEQELGAEQEVGEEEEEEEAEAEESNKAPRVCHTHERAIPIQETVDSLDITEEGIETILCYLELHPQQWVEMLHPTLSTCRLVCYSGPQQLGMIAKICPPVAVTLARQRMAGVNHAHTSSVEFDVVELSDSMGWELLPVKRGLRQLQWNTQRGPTGFKGTGKSGVLVEFSNLSFHFRSYGDLTHRELDGVCQFLHQRVLAQEKTRLYQLLACFKAFRSVAYRNCSSCADELDVERSLKLKALLKDYFDKKVDLDLSKQYQEYVEEEEALSKFKIKDWEDQIRADIRSFLSTHVDEKFSGRAIARIFHGIGSPCYPAVTYGRDRRYWRKYINFDFNDIIRMATQEIIGIK